MRSTLFRHKVGLLLLAALLAAPWAVVAAPRPGSPGPAKAAAPVAQSLWGHLWSFLTIVWSDEGCYIDPNGAHCGGAASQPGITPQGDEGCYIDPDGRHCAGSASQPAPIPHGDTGCYIDPSGGGHCGS